MVMADAISNRKVSRMKTVICGWVTKISLVRIKLTPQITVDRARSTYTNGFFIQGWGLSNQRL